MLRVRETIIAVEKQQEAFYSLSYPACKARALYYIVCGLFGPIVLSHKRHDFQGKKDTGHKMCVLIFSRTFLKYFSLHEEFS